MNSMMEQILHKKWRATFSTAHFRKHRLLLNSTKIELCKIPQCVTQMHFIITAIVLLCLANNLQAAQQQQSAQRQQAASQQASKQNAAQRQSQSQKQVAKAQSQAGIQQSTKVQKTPQGRKKQYASNAQASQENDEGVASSQQVRQFHEVLNDLLTEFSYDVKQGQINGLKNISVRKVSTSDALPKTYEQYVELLVTERIRENSKVRVINCVSCKTKSSILNDGKLMITSPATNIGRMDEAAQQLNIENFMDVILVYHTTHMVLAFSVFNTTTKEEVWSRTYNSETLRSRYQKLAVDMNQVEKSRSSDVYVPDYKFLFGIGGSQLPNVAGEARDKSFLGLHLRSMEKFDNRRSEFGLLSSFWMNTSNFLKSYPSEGQSDGSSTSDSYTGEARPLPYKYVLGIHAMGSRIFVGDVESYDQIRQGIHGGIGAILSTGYLAPSVRAGWDLYFGRRWVLTIQAQYILQSNILVGSKYQKSRAGVGGDLALSLNL